ncbi:hypothetical protein ACKKBG_A00745 [Auxenochlorella protothecoides x Auxenochlorella symbiontica]
MDRLWFGDCFYPRRLAAPAPSSRPTHLGRLCTVIPHIKSAIKGRIRLVLSRGLGGRVCQSLPGDRSMERDSSLDQATEGAGESSAQRAPSLQRAEAGGASPADSTQDPGGTFVLKDIVEPGQGPSPSTGALAPIREEDVSCLASEGADKVPSDLHQPDSPAIAAAYSGGPPVSWQSANGEKLAAVLEQPWDAPDLEVPVALASQPRVTLNSLRHPKEQPMEPCFGLQLVRGGFSAVERFVVFQAVDVHGRHAVFFRSHAERSLEEMLDRARVEAQCAVPDTHHRGWGSDPSIQVFAVRMGTVRWEGPSIEMGDTFITPHTVAHLTVDACCLPELPVAKREPQTWRCDNPGHLENLESICALLVRRVATVHMTMGSVRSDAGTYWPSEDRTMHKRPVPLSRVSLTYTPKPKPQGGGRMPPRTRRFRA